MLDLLHLCLRWLVIWIIISNLDDQESQNRHLVPIIPIDLMHQPICFTLHTNHMQPIQLPHKFRPTDWAMHLQMCSISECLFLVVFAPQHPCYHPQYTQWLLPHEPAALELLNSDFVSLSDYNNDNFQAIQFQFVALKDSWDPTPLMMETKNVLQFQTKWNGLVLMESQSTCKAKTWLATA